MFTFSIFIFSGVIIASLTIAKRMEEKKRRSPIVLRAVSHGDESVRQMHHKLLHQYSRIKDKSAFWVKKQIPLKMKSLVNKLQTYAKEKGEAYLGNVRGSRLLQRSGGISEFFKNISEIEKGAGEINEALPKEIRSDFYLETATKPIEVTETRVATIITKEVEEKPVHLVTALEPEPVVNSIPKKRRTYKPRARKLAVVEVAE